MVRKSLNLLTSHESHKIAPCIIHSGYSVIIMPYGELPEEDSNVFIILTSLFFVSFTLTGWYEGERLRDLQCGWFPSNFTMEIQNEHTRARNLRETHRLNSLLAANDMILSCVQQNR